MKKIEKYNFLIFQAKGIERALKDPSIKLNSSKNALIERKNIFLQIANDYKE